MTAEVREHLGTCASFCTNFNGRNNSGPCTTVTHYCWCTDGALSYEEWNKKHSGSTTKPSAYEVYVEGCEALGITPVADPDSTSKERTQP